MKILVVVDMQNDFITGPLGTPEAMAIVPKVAEKIKQYRAVGDVVLFTQDTHYDWYLNSQEGKNLPVQHCQIGTSGWQLVSQAWVEDMAEIHKKNTFGSVSLAEDIETYLMSGEEIESVELVGVCTGICVLSNAAVIKAFSPELPIIVDASCCACVTPESHKTALTAMKLLQIKVVNEEW